MARNPDFTVTFFRRNGNEVLRGFAKQVNEAFSEKGLVGTSDLRCTGTKSKDTIRLFCDATLFAK